MRSCSAFQAASAAFCSASFLLRPGAGAERLAADPGHRRERLGVVRALLAHHVLRDAERERRGQLLQRGLPVQPGAALGRVGQHRVEQLVHDLAGLVEAVLHVDGAEQRLQRVGEDAGLVPAAGDLLAAAEPDVRAQPVRAQPAGHVGERAHVHHRGAQLGQLPLGQVRVPVEERVGDHQAEHRVAEELQPLVGRQAAVLVRVRPVGEGATDQLGVQGDAERALQRGGFRTGAGNSAHAD